MRGNGEAGGPAERKEWGGRKIGCPGEEKRMDRFKKVSLSVFAIAHYWNKLASEEMGRRGLKGKYAMYLLTLADSKEDLTAARLSELTQRDKGDVSRAISAFQEAGVVEPYGKSKYRAPIRLTPLGKEIAEEVREKARKALEMAGEGLSDEMRLALDSSLEIIVKNLKEIYREGKLL